MSFFSQDPFQNQAANALSKHKEQIISHWTEDVKKQIPNAHNLSRAVIVDTFPVFLDNLMDTLDEEEQDNSRNDPVQVAQEHGEERALMTEFTPDNISSEYHLLKKNILKVVADKATGKDLMMIGEIFQEAERNSVEAFKIKKNFS